ncbi:MAG: crossover junction endodeoxyribonuclease RuvC [Rhodocyclaceae bacterium]|nr:crossover junction endodeoxyribonuclease RuvC [Rhodocyclaceae bacterium]
MRILGIDPGLRVTGFGVIDMSGPQLAYVASGRVRGGERMPLPERIRLLVDGIGEVVREYAPQVAVVEQVFVNVNPKSTLLLGQARGAVIATLVGAHLPVAEYTALQIKQAVVGAGKAGKQQVAHMVARLLALPVEPEGDAADALACAICHAHSVNGYGGRRTGARSGGRVRSIEAWLR